MTPTIGDVLIIEKILRHKLEPPKRTGFHANPPAVCDGCDGPIGEEFVDGRSRMGPWGNFCLPCWARVGVGRLGIGHGQRYCKRTGSRFEKVEG